MFRHRKQHFSQMINYYRYLNTRSNCFCDPGSRTKKFTSLTNTTNSSNYVRVANILASPSSLLSARVQFATTSPEALDIFESFNNAKLLNVPKNRF
jgi:hypothetical protein